MKMARNFRPLASNVRLMAQGDALDLKVAPPIAPPNPTWKVAPPNKASPLKVAPRNWQPLISGIPFSPRGAAVRSRSRRARVMCTPRASMAPVSPTSFSAAAVSSSLP